MAIKTRTTLLLNWYANPYHTPIFAAKALGYYEEEGIKLAILETTDPGDVTEIVGIGSVDFGLKAMIHTIAPASTTAMAPAVQKITGLAARQAILASNKTGIAASQPC